MVTKKEIRCAIYTRKSTEEGLEQDFNSLDAQRMAGENYIASQAGEGWLCLEERYDDGGFTGGNMERPALKRLLADIEAGKIDCIVVYKVDRLSRSLLDFARIMTVFEDKGVSFVSVTQQFNTTSSMGRLTLNILLSFAQFEREVISERTRDKIAMARKQGKFSGGRPVLGYDIAPKGGSLVINEAEAQQVRSIFELYIERQSLLQVIEKLDNRGWANKTWVTKKGNLRKGKAFRKNSLYSLLTNPLYTGKVRHHGKIYDGEHDGIVDRQIFEQVQSLLAQNARSGGNYLRSKYGGILKGILRCKACDCGMSHSFSKKDNKRYRYYVCQNAQSRGWRNCPHPSLPADEIERFVVDEIRRICQDENLIKGIIDESRNLQKARNAENEKRHKLLQKELVKYNSELQTLSALTNEPYTAERMAAVQDRIRMTEQEISHSKSEIAGLNANLINTKEIKQICKKFDPLWDTLNHNEQWRILSLLLERVEYDSDDNNITITFHPTGIKSLNNERHAV